MFARVFPRLSLSRSTLSWLYVAIVCLGLLLTSLPRAAASLTGLREISATTTEERPGMCLAESMNWGEEAGACVEEANPARDGGKGDSPPEWSELTLPLGMGDGGLPPDRSFRGPR